MPVGTFDNDIRQAIAEVHAARRIAGFVWDFAERMDTTPNRIVVGITADLDARLDEHGVQGPVFSHIARSNAVARESERLLINDGFDGGVGGNTSGRIVYAFLR